MANLLVVVLLAGCRFERCEEAAPELSFDSYEFKAADPQDPTSTDTLIIKTRFIDCQGDVGLRETDEGFNLRTYLYEYLDGEWQRFYPDNLDDTTALFAKIPHSSKLKEGVKAEALLEQKLGGIRQNSDSVRFETYLFDREGNRSNTVLTPDYVLP